ncbi:MAG TPA: adenylosuccinate synthase [Dehalococcoidia bacterium]|nr:adenylosuccinate synthase [Dehalococcoidia bacterium]
MPTVAIIGAQWGDEGKGKVVDMLAAEAQMVVRFSGGSNAGHTVVNPYGEFRLHLVPAGIFHPQTTCIIGNGVVVDPEVLLEELELLAGLGIDTSRLFISSRAHLVMPYHTLLDGLEEEFRGRGAIGTTRKGIGPAFMDKAARLGIRMGDLQDAASFRDRLDFVLDYKNAILTKVFGREPLSKEDVYNRYLEYAQKLAPYIRDTEPIIAEALDRGDLVILEGAQGTMLDPDFGTYPYVTSSPPTAAGACLGMGLSPTKINSILGVFKAYTTRVGGGPMPTELKDEVGERIRERGQEYGATTGRPRRCGWLDGVVLRFSAGVNGFTGGVLTRLDVLDIFPTVKICTAYQAEGSKIERFPSSLSLLERCQPVYEELPGWEAPTDHVRRFEDLPPQAQAYVRRIEELMGCPISIVSVGPRREQTIRVRPIL